MTGIATQTNAASVTWTKLYDPDSLDPANPTFVMAGPENRSVLLYAQHDVELTSFGATFDPEVDPRNFAPSAYLSIWLTTPTGDLIGTHDNSGRIFHANYRFDDVGLDRYEFDLSGLNLSAGSYYAVGLQLNFNAIMPRYREAYGPLPVDAGNGLTVLDSATVLGWWGNGIVPAFEVATVVPTPTAGTTGGLLIVLLSGHRGKR